MDQYIGKLLSNRYELQEQIDRDWMTIVYKARCRRLHRLVAVKILRNELALDSNFRRRFHNQYQTVARLSHPNIMSVYDVGYSDQVEYVVTEFIEGITLEQYMRKKGKPLNRKEAVYFVTRIMEALSYAHSYGIIHQGIAPQNIMVLRDGSIRITDFGIIQLVLTVQSALAQAPLDFIHYISPEQAMGGDINACSDIYSTGVLLYEMLTGHFPFEGNTLVSVAIQHINSIPPAPRELNPDIPEALEAITMKAMATNIDQRYAFAYEMLVDLKKFQMNPDTTFKNIKADSHGKTVCKPKLKVGKTHKKQHGVLHLLIPSIVIILLISTTLLVWHFSVVDQPSIFISQAIAFMTIAPPSELNITIFGILLTVVSLFIESKNKKTLCMPSMIFLIIGMLLISIALSSMWLTLT